MATGERRSAPGWPDARSSGPQREPSVLYKAVMTPVIFITFLVSLTLVDYRYSVVRSHYHADTPSRLPAWLHRIIYRYQPYQYVVVDDRGNPTGQRADPRYLHSKQRKLMKMEVVDAFEIRSTVLVALGLLSLGFIWVFWRIASAVVDLLAPR